MVVSYIIALRKWVAVKVLSEIYSELKIDQWWSSQLQHIASLPQRWECAAILRARRNSWLQRYNNVTYQPRKRQRVYNVVNYKETELGKINTYQDILKEERTRGGGTANNIPNGFVRMDSRKATIRNHWGVKSLWELKWTWRCGGL